MCKEKLKDNGTVGAQTSLLFLFESVLMRVRVSGGLHRSVFNSNGKEEGGGGKKKLVPVLPNVRHRRRKVEEMSNNNVDIGVVVRLGVQHLRIGDRERKGESLQREKVNFLLFCYSFPPFFNTERIRPAF